MTIIIKEGVFPFSVLLSTEIHLSLCEMFVKILQYLENIRQKKKVLKINGSISYKNLVSNKQEISIDIGPLFNEGPGYKMLMKH